MIYWNEKTCLWLTEDSKHELLLRFSSLQVPPGARAKSKMTVDECKKTKDIVNLRIHIERAINRIKFFEF